MIRRGLLFVLALVIVAGAHGQKVNSGLTSKERRVRDSLQQRGRFRVTPPTGYCKQMVGAGPEIAVVSETSGLGLMADYVRFLDTRGRFSIHVPVSLSVSNDNFPFETFDTIIHTRENVALYAAPAFCFHPY